MKTLGVVFLLMLTATAVMGGGSKGQGKGQGKGHGDGQGDGHSDGHSDGHGDGHGDCQGDSHGDAACDDDDSARQFYVLDYEQCPTEDRQLLIIKQLDVKLKGDEIWAFFKFVAYDANLFIVDADDKGVISASSASNCDLTRTLSFAGPFALKEVGSCTAVADGVVEVSGKVKLAEKSAFDISLDDNKLGLIVSTIFVSLPSGRNIGCMRVKYGFCMAPTDNAAATATATATAAAATTTTAAATGGKHRHHNDDDGDDDDEDDEAVELANLQCGTCTCNDPIVTKCNRLLGNKNSCGQSFGSDPKCCFSNCCARCTAGSQTCTEADCKCVDTPTTADCDAKEAN